MSLQEQKKQIGDAEVEAALKNFRASMHAWSEEEFARTRPVAVSARVGSGSWMRNPIAGWALGCAIAVAAVGVPVTVHHQRVVTAEHEAAVQEQARLAAEASRIAGNEAAANSVSDEELLRHVDNDIAQAAPDAMQPLADLMSGTNKN